MKSVFFRGYPEVNMRLAGPLLAFLVVCSLLAPVAGGAAATNAGHTHALQQADSADTTMRVDLRSDGTAHWNVTMRFALGDGEHETFEELVSEYEAGDASEGPRVSTFEALAERGSDAAGRSMDIEDVERSGAVSGDVGRLTLTFSWTRFAAVFPGEIIVGDAFDAWALDDDQRLVVSPPSGYLLQDAQPGSDSGVNAGIISWDGPTTFAEEQPRIVYATGGPPPTTTTTTTGDPGNGTTDSTTTGTTSPGGPGDGDGTETAALAAFALATILASGYVLYRQRDDDSVGGDGRVDAESAGDAGAGAESDGDDTAQAGGEAGAAGAAGSTGASADDEDEPDETLLSDEERVLRLLESNGGRMKQANIVEETDWSNAKVSQLLSRMAEDEQVEKLRIGRENLISLPDYEE